jgi:hypothetical protein
LESSGFDLSLGDEESGSQVVALDEDEADEGAATAVGRGKPRRAAADDDVEEIDDLLIEDDIEDEEEVAPRRLAPAASAAPASWGALPVAILGPCVLIMFVVGIMSFELLHGMWGYKTPHKPTGFVTKTIAGWFNEKIPE